jgi:DNA repair protein RadC
VASTQRSPDALSARALSLGVSALGEVELVALIVGASRGDAARAAAGRLLERSLARLTRAGVHDVARAAGISKPRALRLCAAFELGRRASVALAEEHREWIGSFAEVERWARPRLAHLEHEEVWLLSLDGRNRMRSARRIAQGGAHGCALTPRDVLGPAVAEGASGIVLVHNHPSGDPTPSPEDVAMTRAIAGASELLGVSLLDHVVVARGGAESVFDSGSPVLGDCAAPRSAIASGP